MSLLRSGVAALAVVLPPLAGCAGSGEPPSRVAIGAAAPAYAAATLEGDTVHLEDLAGQVVLLNVWATWCPPCREEMPALQALQDRYADHGLRVVTVSIDHARGAPDIRSFIENRGLTLTVLHDPDGRISRVYRTAGVPESFLIDRDGVIAYRWIGPFDPLSPDAITRVEQALHEG